MHPSLLNAAAVLIPVTSIAPAQSPIPLASEVRLRHQIYRGHGVTAYLLNIPPGEGTQMHCHEEDILSVFVSGWGKSVGRLGTVLASIGTGFALSAGMEGSTVVSLFAVPAAPADLALAVISLTSAWTTQHDTEEGTDNRATG